MKTTTHSQDQDTEPETQIHSQTSYNQLISAQAEDLTDMEAKPRRDGAAAAEVPDCEKPSVPLNSLKMMFEKGENLTDKASILFSVMVTCRFGPCILLS